MGSPPCLTAEVVYTPSHDGDGYSWGADAILIVEGFAVNFGNARELAEQVAAAIRAAMDRE